VEVSSRCRKDSTGRAHLRPARRWSKTSAWTTATVLIPIVVAVVALVISGLAYTDQHTADSAALAAAATASEHKYADQVAFWIDVGRGARLPVIMVENLGSAPIANAQLTLRLTLPSTVPNAYYTQAFALGVIPPCTVSSTVMTAQQAREFEGDATPSASDFGQVAGQKLLSFDSWLNFTDASGRSWQRNGDGGLRELTRVSAMPAVVSLQSTYEPTATCS
jgi:hypothetical protein